MPCPDERLWPFLLQTLHRPSPVCVSCAEVLAAGLDPEALVQQGLAEYGQRDGYRPAACEHRCTPNLDFRTRAKKGLVGVACPNDDACWPGWRWVPQAEVQSLHITARRVIDALRNANHLAPIESEVPQGVISVGQLDRRGLKVPVIWIRSPRDLELLAQSVRGTLGGDGLIVLVPRGPCVRFEPRDAIVVLEVVTRSDGQLELSSALDALVPEYRKQACSRANSGLDVDWIHLHFATTEQRHVLLVNGHELKGFGKRDTVFARFLFLAASRKYGSSQGWRNKATLVGRFSARPDKAALRGADKALEALRKELVADTVPGLTENEQDAILKAERGTQKIRISVVPENIEFHESLAELTWKVPTATVDKRTQPRLTQCQGEGMMLANALLAEARRLGIPGKRDPDYDGSCQS